MWEGNWQVETQQYVKNFYLPVDEKHQVLNKLKDMYENCRLLTFIVTLQARKSFTFIFHRWFYKKTTL